MESAHTMVIPGMCPHDGGIPTRVQLLKPKHSQQQGSQMVQVKYYYSSFVSISRVKIARFPKFGGAISKQPKALQWFCSMFVGCYIISELVSILESWRPEVRFYDKEGGSKGYITSDNITCFNSIFLTLKGWLPESELRLNAGLFQNGHHVK